MKQVEGAGKALILALFCVSLAGCDSGGSDSEPPTILQSDARDPDVRAFYEARQWQAAWDGQSEKALRDALAQAPAHGLKADMFLGEPLPQDRNARDAALTKAALRYASALAAGYVDPSRIAKIYTIPRPKANLAAGLAQALANGQLGELLASLPPQTDEYRALSEAYLQYLAKASQNDAQTPIVAPGKPLKPGWRDERLPAIAASLVRNGYLAPPAPNAPPPRRYSPAMVAAVKRLQTDYGIKADGIIALDTVDALNTGPADRARQLAVALERLRWLDRNPPATRIDVNTAAAFLDYWRGGLHADTRKVVVGQPDWKTPQIQGPIFQLVANPYWRVPDSIVEDEISKKSQAFLSANGFEYRDGKLVQRPGPKNSLGIVKFDMRDDQSIYLHDTPAKALFAMPERHRSHGCVRVENALDFAIMLAAEDAVLPKFQESMASGDEKFVKLRTEIPVRLMYHSAFFDGAKVQFRPDIYGWDDPVAAALGLGRVRARPSFKRFEGDVGP